MMNVDMIADIVKAIKKEYDIDAVEVSYDFMPIDIASLIDGMKIVLADEENDWIATGEMWIIPSKVGEDDHIDIILLKRGVTLSFVIPQTLQGSAIDE